MEAILEQILGQLKDLKDGQDKTNSRLDRIETRLENVEEQLVMVKEQAIDLTEFKTDTTESLEEIKDGIEFLHHKEQMNEKEIYKLKTRKQFQL
ncbi:hypothetical protein RH915_10205 [Serpentinicella sp. ANB-PHB4]|uniref:hypothetical protein n=1 Tax=Serpentinicella sp. ANB-PHB4 TaxID=3074076 RepID=UPI00285A3645|nr:hypothetical protein [Serpentinicella sp. ANB-PHB4]MDR5659861.1 hypothetical protein [Serpentinicella sp. ANB-PHB4]